MSRKYKVPLGLVGLSSDPVSATDGDIYYNTETDVVRVYANGAWANIASAGSGIANVVEDLTPQLGGDLDAQGNNITNVEYLGLDTTPASEPTATGSLWWNQDFETLNVKLDSDVTLQVGQEHVVYAKNMTGSTIPDVTAVMFAGTAGNKVRVTPAVSTSANKPYTFLGITTQAIADGGFGFVTQFGMINNIDTSAWTDGALLYVDPTTPGGLTSTMPSAPNWTFPVAAVIASNATSGKILVRATTSPAVDDLSDVTVSTPADNDLLAYNSGTGTWVNQTASEANLATSDHTHSGLVPSGGTAGQVLSKNSATDYDTEWVDQNITNDTRYARLGAANAFTVGGHTITNGAVSTIPLQIQAFASQTANNIRVLNPSSSTIFSVSAGGSVYGQTLSLAASFAGTQVIGVQPYSASVVPVVIRGAASQTADLTEWQNSAGTRVAAITAFGSGMFGGNNALGSSLGIQTAGNAAQKGITVRGASGQTANLQEWQDSASNTLLFVGSGGQFRAGSSIAGTGWAINNQVYGASVIPLAIRGAASQTANLQEWQDSAGTISASYSLGPTGLYVDNNASLRGVVGIGGNSSTTYQMAVYNFSSAPARIPLMVRGAASQTANLQEWQNSAGTVGFRVRANPNHIGFDAASTAAIYLGSTEIWRFDGGTPRGSMFTAFGADYKGLVVRGAASQTANLQEWQNSAGTATAYITSGGSFRNNDIRTTGNELRIYTEAAGGVLQLRKATSTSVPNATDYAKLMLRDGTTAGTLKLVIRAGTAGAETTILDNIPQS